MARNEPEMKDFYILGHFNLKLTSTANSMQLRGSHIIGLPIVNASEVSCRWEFCVGPLLEFRDRGADAWGS